MIEPISTKTPEQLAQKLKHISTRNVAFDAELMGQVAAIIEDVRVRGDAALIDYTARFDGCSIQSSDLKVTPESLQGSADRVDPVFREALAETITRVRKFHQCEHQRSWSIEGSNGGYLAQRISAVESAGLYVPGGTASYPSSVVMNVVPAQVAGVEKIVVATPPRSLSENPAVAAALVDLGITEVYVVGGAQAIAALAYGTETVPRVDKITGPGNRYVAAAKKLVFGAVGIDSVAGPTEVIVIADETARASFVAADMLAQAEHAEDASAILITTSSQLADDVARELTNQIKTLPRREIAEASLSEYGAIIVAGDMSEACALVNEMAPEHLQIMTQDGAALASEVRHVGAIFIGEHSPEAVGDYLAGPNHVLPTARTARFASALSVYDFVKRTNIVSFSGAELKATAKQIAVLARAEGLEAHARSALLRTED
jgi:histidinol dehydrogenase